jgi:hypothetical protein
MPALAGSETPPDGLPPSPRVGRSTSVVSVSSGNLRSLSFSVPPPPLGRAVPPPLPVEVFEHLRDRLEAYVMSELYDVAFGVAGEDVAEDAEVAARFDALAWLGPEQLRTPAGAYDPLVIRCAAAELAAMNARVTPQGKMAAIMSAFSVVYRALVQAARRSGASVTAPSADDFLPATIFLVLHANPPRMMSNLAYIERFRDEQQLMGKAGYCFISVRSCVAYLMGLDATGVAAPRLPGAAPAGSKDNDRGRDEPDGGMDPAEFAARSADCAEHPELFSWVQRASASAGVGSTCSVQPLPGRAPSAAAGNGGGDDAGSDDEWRPRLRVWKDG